MFYNIAALILLFNCATCSNECLYRSCSCFVTNGEYYLTCQDTHYDLGINLSLVPVEIYSSNFKLNGLNLLKEESFKDLKVNSLDLSNNNLEEIPSRVNELTSLKALNLSHNRISILRTSLVGKTPVDNRTIELLSDRKTRSLIIHHGAL